MATFGQTPRTISFDVISESWQAVQKNIGTYIVGTIIVFVVGCMVGMINNFFWNAAIIASVGNTTDSMAIFKSPLYYMSMLSGMAINALIMPLAFGLPYTLLRQLRGESVTISTIFEFGNSYMPLVAFFLVFNIATTIGFYLCCIPGLILTSLWYPAAFLIRDRNMSLGDAIKTSSNAIMPFLGTAVGILFVGMLIMIAGAIPCGLGLVVTIPIYFGIQAVIYRNLFDDQTPQGVGQGVPQGWQ